jgi:hypothetical protein
MSKIDEILDERNGRYGNYIDQATIAEDIREVLLTGLNGKLLEADQSDALHMIAVKLSRICNGDPDYADNWRDIAGYATLVADRLEGKVR